MRHNMTNVTYDVITRVPGVHAPLINRQMSRDSDIHHRKIVSLKKELKENLARVATRERDLKLSMLAYTDRMQDIWTQKQGFHSVHVKPKSGKSLMVHAKHIPKFPSSNGIIKRKLVEKTNVTQKPTMTKVSAQDHKKTLPGLESPRVKLSLVNASDLYDLADLRKDENKNNVQQTYKQFETSGYINMVKEQVAGSIKADLSGQSSVVHTDNNIKHTHTRNPHIHDARNSSLHMSPVDESLEKTFDTASTSTTLETDYIDLIEADLDVSRRSRTLRAQRRRNRRMRLPHLELDSIPEDDFVDNRDSIKLGEDKDTKPSKPKVKSKLQFDNLRQSYGFAEDLGGLLDSASRDINMSSFDSPRPEPLAPLCHPLLGSITQRRRLQNKNPLPPIESARQDNEGKKSDPDFDSLQKYYAETQRGKNSKRHRKRRYFKQLQESTVEEEFNKLELETNKYRAQKQFRKLIFLRDMPDRYYHRS